MQLFRGSISEREFLHFKVSLDNGLDTPMRNWLRSNYTVYDVVLKAGVKHPPSPAKVTDCQIIYDSDSQPMAVRFRDEADALDFIFNFK